MLTFGLLLASEEPGPALLPSSSLVISIHEEHVAQLDPYTEHPDAARAVLWKCLLLSVKAFFFLLVPSRRAGK